MPILAQAIITLYKSQQAAPKHTSILIVFAYFMFWKVIEIWKMIVIVAII